MVREILRVRAVLGAFGEDEIQLGLGFRAERRLGKEERGEAGEGREGRDDSRVRVHSYAVGEKIGRAHV